MTAIDHFINIPLLIAIVLTLIVLIFFIIAKSRNTSKFSFVLFTDLIILPAGLTVASITESYIYIVFTLILCLIVALPYAVFKAFDSPKKREEKQKTKNTAEVSKDNASVTNAALAELEFKYKKNEEISKDLILKVSSFFSNENTMEGFLDYCNTLLTEKTSSDGCVILIADGYDNILSVKSFKGTFPPPYKLPEDLPHKPIRVETNLKFAQFPFNGNIFGDLYTEGKPVLIEDSIKDHRVYQNGPEEFLRTGSYMFAPIKEGETVIGLVALSRNPDNEHFGKDEFETLTTITNAIGVAMKPLYSFLDYAEHTELNKGGNIACKYQKELLPAKLPVLPNVTIGCFSNQAENVCGDYYDIIASRKDKVSFIMCDVAGKGMNSLVVMIMIRAILRLAVNTAQSASTIMSWANRGICSESSKIDHFASVSLINYNSSSKEVEIANCGNNPIYLFTAQDKKIKLISTATEPMGVTRDTVFKDLKLKLNSGDIIITCTDGLLESLNENGVQYSSENLSRVVIKNCNASAKDISNRVKEDLKKFCGIAQQYDDQSLLVVKIQ